MRSSSARRYRGKHLSRGSRRTAGGRRTAPASQENRALVRLVACAAVFVLLVAVKLLFPETVSRLAQTAGRLIGRDADFKEAFAAVGRAVSGEEAVGDSLQDAYTAVFNPTDTALAGPTGTAAAIDPSAAYISYALPRLPEPEPAAEDAAAAAQDSVPTAEPAQETAADDTATTEAISYVYTMAPLPENASLELRNLGFSYQSPLVGKLTSAFGWREHPVTGGNKFHYGVDLAAETGTDICAFADGEVYAVGESSTLGKYIMLRHENGYVTLYAHCSKVTVSEGTVAMGDKIAEVGETGQATGPHLHFELHDGDLYLNPIYYVEIG